ncbi:MAG TPA: tripartite tricarboxylate transporter substrate binding protein, partial [Pseudorhodoplanes sp.]|nr:tripartite tricarboxylate transporter substrate binding protein [Pseudorhodoplanes sp.]
SPRMTRRLVLLIALSLPFAFDTNAQDYPSRPITLIVPFAPGGSTDVIARVVGEAMHKELGQPVVIENRAGAGGSLGTAAIAKAAPDGYTIGMGTASTLAINPAAYKSLTYDVQKDLAPIGNIAVVPNIMSVNASVAAPDMAAFIALARTQPGKLAYGSSGNGSVSHLMGEQFKLASKTDLLHVPYRGIGPALQDAVGGQIQVMFDNLPTSLPLVQDGKLRALAVSGDKRLPVLPNVPTFAEAGLDDLNWMAFFGLIAPAGTPQPVIAKLNAALKAALSNEAVRNRLATQQATPIGNSPAEFSAEIARDLERMRRAVTAAKIEIN